MSKTYHLLDKGRIDPDNIHEDNYVTYMEPSMDDENWSLTFTEASSPKGYYYAVWRFIDDECAREEYPIFRTLAMARNWAPIESRPITKQPCAHTQSSPKALGETQLEGIYYRVYLCADCDRVYLGGTTGEAKFASRGSVIDRVQMLNDWHRQGTL